LVVRGAFNRKILRGDRVTAPMEVTVAHNGAAATVVVAGELDLSSADRLRDALRGEVDAGRPVLVDLRSCTFIDSVGLSVLIQAAQRGRTLAIVSPSAAVRRLLELARLESLIPVFDSEAEAGALAASQASAE